MDRGDIKPGHQHAKVRLIVGANILLLLAWFGVCGIDSAYGTLREANLADSVGWGVYLALFGSTLFAIGLFFRGLLQRRRPPSTCAGTATVTMLDGVLLLAWCLALGTLCLYGLMLGLRGF